VTSAEVATWQQNVARLLPPIPAIPPEWREKQKNVAPSSHLEAGKDGRMHEHSSTSETEVRP
jgi:hypothetical protein